MVCSEDTLDSEMGDCICQLKFPHVYEESEMMKEISTLDGFLHVSGEENPREGMTNTETECERTFAISNNWGVIYCC